MAFAVSIFTMSWLLNILFLVLFPIPEYTDLSSLNNQPINKRSGTYSLVQGTQGCPQKISWENKCQGIVLFKLDDSTTLPFRSEFCQINQKTQSQQQQLLNGVQVQRSQVRFNENILKKIDEQFFISNGQRIRLQSTQVLILGTNEFMWERDHLGQGTSCLYRK